MGKLEGKVAIVTGASRGIGRAVAQFFAAEGAKVVCAARTLNEGEHFLGGSLNTTVSEIEKAGGTALAAQTDLSHEEDCTRLVETAKRQFGPVDILVNNAVVLYGGPTKDLTLKRWDTSWAIGPRAIFILCKEVLPDMIERRSGAIVNISSSAAVGPGRGPYPDAGTGGGCLYGAQKAAVERFTQGLAAEVYRYGITVAAVSPCLWVATPGTVYQHLVSAGDIPSDSAEWSAKAIRDDPRGREPEPPEMMARAILLLATEPIDKVTGRVTYSLAILKEFGWITDWITKGEGYGIDKRGSGYSEI